MNFIIVEDGKPLDDENTIIEASSIEEAEEIANKIYPRWILIKPTN